MSRLVSSVRSAVAKARASVPFGQYLPNNKVVAGALAAGVTLALQKLGVVDIPAAYVSVGAFAVVGYLFPESPVAAAHVVVKAGGASIKRAVVSVAQVRVGPVGPEYTALTAAARDVDTDTGVPNQALQAPVVPPQSA